jgi:hypothetical protein
MRRLPPDYIVSGPAPLPASRPSLDQSRHDRGVEGVGKAPVIYLDRKTEMSKSIYVVLLALIMIAVIVGVDLLFFRNQFWERLTANIGIVLVFIAFYFRFLQNR